MDLLNKPTFLKLGTSIAILGFAIVFVNILNYIFRWTAMPRGSLTIGLVLLFIGIMLKMRSKK